MNLAVAAAACIIGRVTYVKRIDLAVELVDAAALDGAPPLLAVLPHREGLLEAEVARSEEAAAERMQQ